MTDTKRWRVIRHVAYNGTRRPKRTFLVGRTSEPKNEYVRDSRGRLVHFTQAGALARAGRLNRDDR